MCAKGVVIAERQVVNITPKVSASRVAEFIKNLYSKGKHDGIQSDLVHEHANDQR